MPSLCSGMETTFHHRVSMPRCLVGRLIRVGRTHLDRWISLQTILKIIENFHHRKGNPAILNKDILFFLQVSEQVNDLWKRQSLWCVVYVLLLDQMHFPIALLYRLRAVGNIGGESFAI